MSLVATSLGKWWLPILDHPHSWPYMGSHNTAGSAQTETSKRLVGFTLSPLGHQCSANRKFLFCVHSNGPAESREEGCLPRRGLQTRRVRMWYSSWRLEARGKGMEQPPKEAWDKISSWSACEVPPASRCLPLPPELRKGSQRCFLPARGLRHLSALTTVGVDAPCLSPSHKENNENCKTMNYPSL